VVKSLSKFLKGLIKKPKLISLGLIVLAIISFLVWRGVKKNNQQPELQTVKVERGTIVSSVSASGQVLSVNIMNATTKASGIVEQVYVKDGNFVQAGDKILKITLDQQGKQKNTQAYAAYLSAKNTLESAKATQYSLQADMFGKWDTFKELAESDEYKDTVSPNRALPEFHIPEKEWLATEANYKNQEAVVVQARAAVNSTWLNYQLSSPVITSPTDGTVTSLMFASGMSIGSLDMGNSESNQKIATIKTEGMPIISVNLSEIDVSRVELGQKATVTLDSITDKTFTGTMIGVDRIGTYTSGVTQYPAIVRLDSSSPEILPNMAVTANIIVAVKDNTLLVPSSAVVEQDGQNVIRLLENNKEQKIVMVETGLISDIQTEVIGELEEGEMVIVGMVSGDNKGMEDVSPFSRNRGGMGGMMRGAPPH